MFNPVLQTLPAPGPLPSLQSRAGRILSVAVATLLLGACTAPGMKLDLSAGSKPTRERIDGVNVTLRPLNAQTIQALGPRPFRTEELEPLLAEKPAPYLIGPQDVLLVTVWEHPEITQPLGQFRSDAATGQVVDEDGNIFFPYVGMLPVKGFTTSQVRMKLYTQLSRVLKNPQIDVKITAFRSQKVFIGGEVKLPGIQNVTDVPFTLSEAISRVGGFQPNADDSRLLLTRGDRTWTLNYHDMMARSGRYAQLLLKDGDTLRVPSREDEAVYLMGELKAPRAIPLYHGRVSLARALSEAGGMDSLTAHASSVYILRSGGVENAVDVYHLDARHPTSLVMAERFDLQPRDIVYVDGGTLVRWNRVLTLLLPTFSAVSQTGADVKYLSK
ncbi:MAG: polysaccharide biosynthesis/export family protein [Holophagaceae bacterium]|nr:polysaccharide biosynthesis/export family protein [Holophagaceae bacterium]